MNHSVMPNAKAVPPWFVRGKYRLGFLATQEIPEGNEVVWDYGMRDSELPWLRQGIEK